MSEAGGKFQALNVCVTAAAASKISAADILHWVNHTLHINTVHKVPDLGTGEYYCLLLNMLFFPQREPVNLRKVKFSSQVEVDHINNWKLLQSGLKSVGIDKDIQIDRLVKQKPMDNVEFAQWFFKFFDANRTQDILQYDPVEERERRGIVLEKSAAPAFVTSNHAYHKPNGGGGGATNQPAAAESRIGRAAAAVHSTSKRSSPQHKQHSSPAKRNPASSNHTAAGDCQPTPGGAAPPLMSELNRLRTRVEDLTLTVEGLERERDFYFAKLRDIEIKCQERQPPPPPGGAAAADVPVRPPGGAEPVLTVGEVLAVLYSTEDGFATPNVQ